ncbi:MAG: hypothetical protein WAK16_13640 [Candidatus Cybelea sp.]|jgi:hypothetical protein
MLRGRPAAALIRSPPICYRCERLAHGCGPQEDDHVFGKRNSPLTIRYPINDHGAIFSVKQYHWPSGALDSPNTSVLREGIARMHGAYDNVEHILDANRAFAQKFAHLEEQLTIIYGPDWPEKLEAAVSRKLASIRRRRSRNAADRSDGADDR